jgi:predicted CXXCH cytochrome family protein
MTRVLGKWVAVALLVATALWSVQPLAAIKNTKHDLSAGNSTATVKASTEAQICVFCHVPHNSSTIAPLWNHTNTSYNYKLTELYGTGSSSMTATMGQPNGSSLLCLSCHDGTIALGSLVTNGPVTMAGGVTTMPVGASNFNHDLSNHHPVSFPYTNTSKSKTGNTLAAATSLGSKGTAGTEKVKLESGQMQCMSCHDAHDNTILKFLVKSNDKSALCQTCHLNAGWGTSAAPVSIHATVTNSYSGTNTSFGGTAYTSPWTHTSGATVAANACENCHRPHTAPGAARLLNFAKEEDNCLVCHNGSAMTPAVKNIAGEYTKASAHSSLTMSLTGTHDPQEAANVATKHVECVDCHNPHQTQGPASTNAAGSEGALAAPLTGVRGININNIEVNPATHEYEICFRCHGETSSVTGVTPRVTRPIPHGNTRLAFQTTNPSYHPIAGVGQATTSPSLIAGSWTIASTMKCTHCHSNDTGPINGVAGTGPNGPHASANAPILNKAYTYTDPGSNTSYNAANFALCYTCHSSSVIAVDSRTAPLSFRWHRTHLDFGASCSTCHDPHGVPGGTAANNSRLMNFNSTVVTKFPATGTGPFWTKGASDGHGSCNLVCHGVSHAPSGASKNSTY